MCDINKNQLLTLFYHEGKEKSLNKIQKHVDSCDECQDYLTLLYRTEARLKQLTGAQPDPCTFDSIIEKIKKPTYQMSQQKVNIPFTPFMEILFILISLLSLIYIVQTKIRLLPFWQTIEKMEIVQRIGSYGITIILFLCIGMFITLSVTPILYLTSKHTRLQDRII